MMYHTCLCHNYEGRFSNLCVCDNSFQNGLHIWAGKNGTHFFFTKSWLKNNFNPKNQFQQANRTGAQNLTLWPLLYGMFANITYFDETSTFFAIFYRLAPLLSNYI